MICKVIGIIVVLGIGAGLVFCWMFSAATYEDISDGKQRLGCTAAKLTKALVEGQDSPSFIGMTPMTDRFSGLSSVLDDDSTFVAEFNGIIDNTQEIDRAFEFAKETLSLLQEMMANSDNALPDGHTCLICTDLSDQLDSVISTMDDSLASALSNARAEAKSALDGDKREDLRKLLTDSTAPVTDLNELLVDALDPLVDGDTWDEMVNAVDQGRMSMYALPGLGIVATLFGCLGCFAFLLREKRPINYDGQSYEQTQALPHRCSCCSWCCGFLVAALCFFVGGLLQILGVPLGVACLTLDDFSGSVIETTKSALELDLDGDELTMMKDIVDQCLNPPDYTVEANFADILKITSDGTSQTMRALIENDLKVAIDTPFDELQAKIDEEGATTELAEDAGVKALRNFVYDFGGNISGLIMTDESSMATLIVAAGETAPSSGWVGYFTTLRCADYAFEDEILPGNDGFLATLTQLDTTSDCASTPTNTCDAEADCWASTTVMETKEQLVFRCDKFADSLGGECDVWASDANGVAIDYSACMGTDNTYTRMEDTCTIAQFEEYLAKFDERIDVAFKTLDNITNAIRTTINDDLRALLDDQVLDEVTDILDGLSCNFLGEYYKNIIWGACYEGVGGISYLGFLYVIMGAIMCLLTIVTYALWRRSIDNYNWEQDNWGAGSGAGTGYYDTNDTN